MQHFCCLTPVCFTSLRLLRSTERLCFQVSHHIRVRPVAAEAGGVPACVAPVRVADRRFCGLKPLFFNTFSNAFQSRGM